MTVKTFSVDTNEHLVVGEGFESREDLHDCHWPLVSWAVETLLYLTPPKRSLRAKRVSRETSRAPKLTRYQDLRHLSKKIADHACPHCAAAFGEASTLKKNKQNQSSLGKASRRRHRAAA